MNNKLKQRVGKLTDLKAQFLLSDVDLNQLQEQVMKLQAVAKKSYQHPGQDAQAYIQSLNAFANELAVRIQATTPVLSETSTSVSSVASAFVVNVIAAGVVNVEVRKALDSLLEQVEFKAIAEESNTQPVALQSAASQELTQVTQEAQEEHTTFAQAVLDVLKAFYQIICDMIAFITPDYFKTEAQKSKQASDLGQGSMFSRDSLSDSDEDNYRIAHV